MPVVPNHSRMHPGQRSLILRSTCGSPLHPRGRWTRARPMSSFLRLAVQDAGSEATVKWKEGRARRILRRTRAIACLSPTNSTFTALAMTPPFPRTPPRRAAIPGTSSPSARKGRVSLGRPTERAITGGGGAPAAAADRHPQAGSSTSRRGGEPHGEGRALRSALDLDPAGMTFDDLPGDCQPQPGPRLAQLLPGAPR